MITRRIEGAQKRWSRRTFEVPQAPPEYDDVMNKQREAVYGRVNTA